MSDLLRQAFLYYDRDGDGYLSLDDAVVVLRSANVAVDAQDVKYFMNAEFADEGQTVVSVSWDACEQMARLCSGDKNKDVGRAKVRSALKAFVVDGTARTGGGSSYGNKQATTAPTLNLQELHHCLRALTPASAFVTGSDVAAFTLKGLTLAADGTTTEEAILNNF
jgi:hypothetical protein